MPDQQLMPRIRRPRPTKAENPKVGAGGGRAFAENVIINGRGGRFVGTGGLTKKQQKFIHAYVENGGNGQAAARAAGYSVSPHEGRVVHRLLTDPVVRGAIHNERDRKIGTRLASRALSVLEELMTSPATPAPVRYQSARTVLQMAGHGGAEQESRQTPVDRPLVELSLAELEAFVRDGEAMLRVAQAASKGSAPTPDRPVIDGGAKISDEPDLLD
jgi:hypothetical protein